MFGAEAPRRVLSADPRQRDLHQDHVRRAPAHRGDRRFTRGCLADDLQPVPVEQRPQALARQRVLVDDKDADPPSHCPTECVCRSGIPATRSRAVCSGHLSRRMGGAVRGSRWGAVNSGGVCRLRGQRDPRRSRASHPPNRLFRYQPRTDRERASPRPERQPPWPPPEIERLHRVFEQAGTAFGKLVLAPMTDVVLTFPSPFHPCSA
jgi:hypothetical protein